MSADLSAITPEIVLALLGAVLLVLEMFTEPGHKRTVAWVGVIGLLIVLVPSIRLLGTAPRFAFAETYAVDPFAALFKIIAVASGILVLFTAMEFFRDRGVSDEGEVYVLVVFLVLALVALAAAADLIVLFLAFEFVSLISYVLAGSLTRDRKSNEAGIKYFFYGAAASAAMLYGFTFLYGVSGTTNLYRLMQHVAFLPPGFLAFCVLLIVAGFGFKMSLVPFHQWTPDVYEGAPTPITAFLSVGSKAAAFAALLRLLYVAVPPQGWVAILAGLAAISMTLGNLVALNQQNIKRMLAYSSIAHAGYMLVGVVALVASATPVGSGIEALLFYLLGYMFTNLGAFAVATIIGRAIGSDQISDYAGLSRRAPFAAAAMVVFMLSLTGIPPTALFLGKLLIFGAAINSGLLWLAIVGIVNSVVSLFYYFGVIRAMVLMTAPDGAPGVPETGVARVLLGVTMLGTLVMGILPQQFIRLAVSVSGFGRF